MAIATWPETLPQCFLPETFQSSLPENLIRAGMDRGPDKVRPAGADGPYPISGAMRVTLAQWEILKAFIAADLGQGSLPLEFPDPDHGVYPLTVRFTGMPTRVRRGKNFIIQLSFEVLP